MAQKKTAKSKTTKTKKPAPRARAAAAASPRRAAPAPKPRAAGAPAARARADRAKTEEALVRFDLVSRASGVGLWDMTIADGDPGSPKNQFWWSDQFRSMLGFKDESDFPNTLSSATDITHPDDAERVNSGFAALLADPTGKTTYDCQYRMRTKGGEYRWFHGNASVHRAPDGTPLRMAGSIKDIHEEKKTALSLGDAMTRFELINQASGVGLWDMTVIAGDPVNPKNEFWWSDQFRTMLGFTDESDFPNVLESWSSRLHPRDSEWVLAAFAKHLTDRTGKTPYDVEYQLQMKNGEYRWFRATGATMRDAAGVPLRVAGALKDIHEEKKTSLSLGAAMTRFELINQASSVGLWDMSVIAGDPVNPKNEFWWSDQFRTMLGFKDESDFPNVLESWSSRLHPRDSEWVLAAFAKHLTDRTGKTPYDVEYQLQMKSGEYRWFRATGATMRDKDGVPLRVAGALKDIHEEKKTSLSLGAAMTRFELINQASSVGLWDMSVIAGDPVNPKNEFWWSDQFRTMLGFKDESDFPNVLDSWSSRLHATDKDWVLDAFAKHLTDRSGKTPYDVEYQLQMKNGEYRWFRATGATMRDAAGVPLRVAGALKDIHEEKKTSLSLGAAMTRFELINQASSVGLWDMSVIAGDPVNPKNEFWWSDQFRAMLGFKDELDFPNVLDSWSSRLHANDKTWVLDAFAKHLTDRSGKTPYDVEYQLQMKTGEYRWFRATGATMRDKDGVPLRVAGALKDIHDEKETSLALEKLISAAVDGDLTQRIDTQRFDGFMRTIGEHMNRLLDSTADSFRFVKTAIDQVGQASSQLRATSGMMSESSVQLNQTVDRSSNDLSRAADGVKANAESAAMANQLVTHTAQAARDGEQRMSEMNGAMSAIDSSAQQIARIIKVIDEIAFQTNLLALNAAVEAARAGRHGKGFAVVAQEVRSLAERSAKAAKETAELIADSSAKVSQGVKIAEVTRQALSEIVGNVTKVVDLAGEIASASGEQSRALGSVSGSMRQASSVAQAGSQQSTEIAAAADELSRQMKALKERMDKYRISSAKATVESANGRIALTPELIEQVLAAMQSNYGRAEAPKSTPAPAPVSPSAPPPSTNGKSNGASARALLPLDRDERGFDGF